MKQMHLAPASLKKFYEANRGLFLRGLVGGLGTFSTPEGVTVSHKEGKSPQSPLGEQWRGTYTMH